MTRLPQLPAAQDPDRGVESLRLAEQSGAGEIGPIVQSGTVVRSGTEETEPLVPVEQGGAGEKEPMETLARSAARKMEPLGLAEQSVAGEKELLGLTEQSVAGEKEPLGLAEQSGAGEMRPTRLAEERRSRARPGCLGWRGQMRKGIGRWIRSGMPWKRMSMPG